MSAAPVSSCTLRISSRIWAWIVTSRAVVGSSAMSSLGSHERAIAIMTRWRMPPESSCGYCLTRRSGLLMPTALSEFHGLVPARPLGQLLVEDDRLGDLIPDREHGIEAGHRLLEDHRHVVAAHLAHLVVVERQQVAPVEVDLARRDLGGRDVEQAHDRQGGHALAAARFADDAQRLAALDRVGHAIDRPDGAVHDVEVGAQVPNVEQHVRSRGHRLAGPIGHGCRNGQAVTPWNEDRGRRAGRRP